MNKRILLISDFDSRISWGMGVASSFLINEYKIDVFVIGNKGYIKNNASYFKNILEENIYKNLENYQVVIVALGGAANLKFNARFRDWCEKNGFFKKRPVIIMGFNGLVDDKDPHGLFCRIGADFICVNSKRNYQSFSKCAKSFNLNFDSLFLLGYSRDYLNEVELCDTNVINTVSYIDQDLIYRSNAERYYIVENLIEYANIFPDRKILIKLRGNINSTDPLGINKNIKYFFDKFCKKIPNNISFSRESPADILNSSDLLIGFSSTMLIEAIIKKKKVAVLSDFGVSFKTGNHVFINSGLITNFNQLKKDELTIIEDEWFDLNVTNSKSFEEELFISVANKIINQNKAEEMMKLPSLAYDRTDFSFFHRFEKKSNYKINRSIGLIQGIYGFFKKNT